jgi:hypothetical protein
VGALRYETYSGFELVGLTSVLQQLELPASGRVALHITRGLLLAVPVAAVWMTLLAPTHRWHWGYRLASVYLIVAGVGLAAFGLIRLGPSIPMPGIGLLLLASVAALSQHLGAPVRIDRLSPPEGKYHPDQR